MSSYNISNYLDREKGQKTEESPSDNAEPQEIIASDPIMLQLVNDFKNDILATNNL